MLMTFRYGVYRMNNITKETNMTQKIQQLQEAIREVCTEINECTRSLMSCGKIPCKDTDHFGKIELQHVMRAMGSYHIQESNVGEKAIFYGKDRYTRAIYNLTLPLDQQSPEVIGFLHSIICKE